MKIYMSLRCQTILVFFVVMTTADRDYESKLTKLWSSATSSDRRSDVASVSAPPTKLPDRTSRQSKENYNFKKYTFKPRAALPVRTNTPIERSIYYTKENANNNQKSEILFPGDYFPIADVKSDQNKTKNLYNLLIGGPFETKSIPLIRDQEFQKRSLDVSDEPIIEKPEGFSEQSATRRSLSYILGADDEGEEDTENDEELSGDENVKSKYKLKRKKKKLSKYMLPLLMAYKLKYFALVPMMMGGLVLLVAAAGLAGFFFAMFAAVMGLQKGGY